MKNGLLEQVKTIAKEKGVPLYALEEKAGLAKGSISKWNDNEPGIRKVQKVAEYLGVPIEKQNKKITHVLWIIFISIITSLITTILATT